MSRALRSTRSCDKKIFSEVAALGLLLESSNREQGVAATGRVPHCRRASTPHAETRVAGRGRIAFR
jgi:hypothetical protein